MYDREGSSPFSRIKHKNCYRYSSSFYIIGGKILLYNKKKLKAVCAEMAELADAHGSGPCDSNIMRVQVPFPALNIRTVIAIAVLFT